ncbi:MAG: alkaline phosphatase D family protein [Vicinamibacterales bacterium]|jgi:phosphodiesterase/alkaline phosphatase D-like protein
MSNGIRPNGPHLPLHRRLRFGNLIDLHVLDTRQYRSKQACNAGARDNPHLTYHSNKRGYIACTATPKTMQADFRVIDKVTIRGGAARTAATRVVQAGTPGSLVS